MIEIIVPWWIISTIILSGGILAGATAITCWNRSYTGHIIDAIASGILAWVLIIWGVTVTFEHIMPIVSLAIKIVVV